MDRRSDDDFVDYVRERSPALLRFAHLLTAGDGHAAEDLVQVSLIQAFLRWHRLEHPNARDSYVRRIMIRTASKSGRKRAEILKHTVDPGTTSQPDHEAEIDTWRALAELSPRQRAVVVLRYYEDCTEAEIAECLGCSRGAVKSHSSRALEHLRASSQLLDHRTTRTQGNPRP